MPKLTCTWNECAGVQFQDLPVCFVHAWQINRRFDAFMVEHETGMPTKVKHDLVYYLIVGPTTVKIGMTGDLLHRVKTLRSDIQYVVAVEPGGREVETARHRMFGAERIGRREDFRVSARLQAHIDNLRDNTHSDETLEMYRQRAAEACARVPAQFRSSLGV